jgi:hypothetical protein
MATAPPAILIMAMQGVGDRQECLSYRGKSAIPGRLSHSGAAILRIAGMRPLAACQKCGGMS